MKHKEYSGQCQYHYGMPVTRLRTVQLTPDHKEWQRPIGVCSECRDCLRGLFRYFKQQRNKK